MPDSSRQPLVSVILPAYRVAPFIAEAVESVLSQSYPAVEVIVVNDGSPDSLEIEAALAPFRDRITYLVQDNQGAAAARNAGIEAARGSLIAFLDGDDVWYPEFLASQVPFLELGGYDMVYTNALIFGDHPESGMQYMETTPSVGEVTLESLLTLTCQPITSGTLLRRSILRRTGLFNIELHRGQDFELWVRLAHAGARIGYQKAVLLKYRYRPGSLSGTAPQRVRRELLVFQSVRNLVVDNSRLCGIVDSQLRRLTGVYEVELGKEVLAEGDYASARRHFRAAWAVNPGAKLFLVMMFLRFFPGLLRRLYLRWRPDPV